jgi:hypothetical protein
VIPVGRGKRLRVIESRDTICSGRSKERIFLIEGKIKKELFMLLLVGVFEDFTKKLYEMGLPHKMSTIMKGMEHGANKIYMKTHTMIIRNYGIIGRRPDMNVSYLIVKMWKSLGSKSKGSERLSLESFIIKNRRNKVECINMATHIIL